MSFPSDTQARFCIRCFPAISIRLSSQKSPENTIPDWTWAYSVTRTTASETIRSFSIVHPPDIKAQINQCPQSSILNFRISRSPSRSVSVHILRWGRFLTRHFLEHPANEMSPWFSCKCILRHIRPHVNDLCLLSLRLIKVCWARINVSLV